MSSETDSYIGVNSKCPPGINVSSHGISVYCYTSWDVRVRVTVKGGHTEVECWRIQS